jgi:hypothetical protein
MNRTALEAERNIHVTKEETYKCYDCWVSGSKHVRLKCLKVYKLECFNEEHNVLYTLYTFVYT